MVKPAVGLVVPMPRRPLTVRVPVKAISSKVGSAVVAMLWIVSISLEVIFKFVLL